MKLLLNNKEIAYFLLSFLDDIEAIKENVFPSMRETADAVTYVIEEKNKKKFDLSRMREKFKQKIRRAVERDLKTYVDNVNTFLENKREREYQIVHKNLDIFLEKLGKEKVLELYRQSKNTGFVKSTGLYIDPTATLMRRQDFESYEDDCLIRNTVGNENLLISKVDNNHPFWFIDSGYTNFLEPNKKWHRLVRNHLHYGNYFEAPVDRLGSFKKFPLQWRADGEIILIIEPGPFAAGIFHVDLATWKYDVERKLRKFTDKKIVFREKAPKNERTNLFQELLDDDYYCVVNINSNAATEAIWAGVPAITMGLHITNPVTKRKLADINDLYRGSLANWLAMLSYCQFTYDELIDGTAYDILNKYHV